MGKDNIIKELLCRIDKIQNKIIEIENNDELDKEFPFSAKGIPEDFKIDSAFKETLKNKAKEFLLREKKLERLKEKLERWFQVLECALSKSTDGKKFVALIGTKKNLDKCR